MSDEKTPPAAPEPTPDSRAPTDSGPLEVMPDATALPTGTPPSGGQGPADQQALAVIPPAPPKPPAAPIDYAMPTQPKSWLPSPALIRNLGCIFKMLLGFTVMLCMGYFMLMALNPKARQWALQGSQPAGKFPGAPDPGGSGYAGTGIGGGRGPTPFKFMNQMLALPAQALAKTDDVVKANNARAGVVDGMVAEEEKKTKGGSSRAVVNPFASGGGTETGAKGAAKGGRKEGEVDPAEDERAALAARMMELAEQGATGKGGPKADAVRSTALAAQDNRILPPIALPGGIVIASASPEGAPPASRTFFYWVVNAAISGISPGPPARLLVGGRLSYEGDEVNIPLGIVFERLDPGKKLIHFRDQTGAVVTRSY